MRSSLLAGVFAFAGSSAAFSDSSPWIVASTASFKSGPSNDNIQTSDAALKATKDILSTCPTNKYAVVVQPGLHYADLAVEGGSPLKELWTVVDSEVSKGKLVIPEVVGKAVTYGELELYITEACAKQGKDAQLGFAELSVLPDAGDDRLEAFAANDAQAAKELMPMLKGDSYTLIILGAPTTATEPTVYEPEFEETVMMDLKRNVQGHPSRRADNETDWNKLPLFEKYQFFTPGIFMGLLAVLLMGSILTVGIRALASLEVSYGAFEKDMGPAAQKKQQ